MWSTEMNKYSIKATRPDRVRFYSTSSIANLVRKIRELKELGYKVEVKNCI